MHSLNPLVRFKSGIPTRNKHEPRSAWRYRNASLASRALLRSETPVRLIGTGAVTPVMEEYPDDFLSRPPPFRDEIMHELTCGIRDTVSKGEG